MRITKYTHACVRIEHEGRVLVIDPGAWTESEAWAGADAVLVTHEHADHIDVTRLSGVPVYAPAQADLPDFSFTPVSVGEEFTAGGFRVRAFGGAHALIYDALPSCANLGYLVEDAVYHPGDSVFVPPVPVETLCVPMQGGWLKLEEAIDFLKAVKPSRAFGIHDGQLNERGLGSVNAWLEEDGGHGYRWLAPSETA